MKNWEKSFESKRFDWLRQTKPIHRRRVTILSLKTMHPHSNRRDLYSNPLLLHPTGSLLSQILRLRLVLLTLVIFAFLNVTSNSQFRPGVWKLELKVILFRDACLMA